MKNAKLKDYLPLVSAFAAIFILTLGLHFIRVNLASIDNYPTRTIDTNETTVNIEVGQGDHGSDIAQTLYTKGVTASVSAFYQLAVNDQRALQIAPGTHRLSLKISAKQALDQLLDPKRNIGLINVFEGIWRTEIERKLRDSGFTGIEKAISQLKVPKRFSASEGIYFPAQYSFAKGTSAAAALQAMIDRFVSESKKIGLKTNEELIVASLIQAEGDPSDFAKISRVIYNRLKIGMPLQLDTTVQYVLKKRGTVWLSTKSTLVDSPYNTYKRYGLPIAPIGNPGVLAMRAALNPETGDWLYFITVKPGDTRFTKSHDQFLEWKNEYLKNLAAGAFK